MAAKSKAELLQITRKEYDKLSALLGTIDKTRASLKKDDISIKDIVGHRAHWIELFLGWYADGQAGKQVSFPAKGYKWNELNRYNSDLRQRQAGLDWAAATAMLDATYQKLVTRLETLSEAELYDGPMKGARNDWTPGRWAEAAGPSHFRSATRYIRARLKSGD